MDPEEKLVDALRKIKSYYDVMGAPTEPQVAEIGRIAGAAIREYEKEVMESRGVL
jgi:hypothetical protein